MTILETLIRLRDDLKLWVTNNLNKKADITDVNDAVAQKSQVQIITWEDDD